jgi:ankyrin repeat protein
MVHQSPLAYHCGENHLDIVKLLLKEGADVNISSKHGSSPILEAIKK